MTPDFVREMERNLARVYINGRSESDQRQMEVEKLLAALNPDNDPYLRRRRRAVTVDGVTAQVS